MKIAAAHQLIRTPASVSAEIADVVSAAAVDFRDSRTLGVWAR